VEGKGNPIPQGDHHTTLKSELEEIARMLSGLINGMEKRGA
jgi:hypothetical protein